MIDNLAPELQVQVAELMKEYKPRFVELLQSISIEIDENVTDERLTELLQDREKFEEALPEGKTIETLPAEFIEALQELAVELQEKLLDILGDSLFG